MWDKMILIAESEEPAATEEYEIEAKTVLKVDSEEKLRIRSLIIEGRNYYDGGTGYLDENGEWRLNLRIHGKNFLDSEEFCRLARESGAVVIDEDYSEDYFLYRCTTDKKSTVISPTKMMIPYTTTLQFNMTATLDEDIKSGAALVPGLHIDYNSGSYNSIRSKTSGVGDVNLTCTTLFGHMFGGFIHKPVASYMELPIKRDSVYLMESKFAGTPEPYRGQSVSIKLDGPLLGNEEIWDDIDCVSGKITRRLATMKIDRTMPLTLIDEGYITYYRLDLPLALGNGYLDIEEFYIGSIEDFEWSDYIYCPDPENKCIYLQLYVESEEEAWEALDGRTITYELEKPTVTKVNTDMPKRLSAGTNYIEVCTHTEPTVKLVYTKEG